MTNKKKTKKEKIIDDIEDEDIESDKDIEYNHNLNDDNDIIDSSLEIGGQIHTQSNIVKKFVQLPNDVKYSKFNNIDLANFTLKSRTYQLWIYIKKIQRISKDELISIKEIKKQIYDIETLDDLKEHLEENKKGHIWYNLIQNMTLEQLKHQFKDLLEQLIVAKEDGVLEYIYGEKEHFYNSYNNYLDENNSSSDIDDFGLMSTMMTITEIKKAHTGWAAKMMNTTINVTKDENIEEDTEEEPEKKEGFFNKLKK